MKTSLTSYAAMFALVSALTAPLSVAASSAPTKLAGVELGMGVDEAKSIIEKGFPGYVHVTHDTEDFGVPYTMHAWRKLNPDADHYYYQELESVVVAALEDGSVFQIGRAQSVAAGAMDASTLVAAAKENLGEATEDNGTQYQWHSDENCSTSISTSEVGRPGVSYRRGRLFDMKKDVFLRTRLFQEYDQSCQRRAEMLIETHPDGSVSFYATTLVDTAAFIERYKATQEAPAEAGSAKPAF